MQMESLAQLAGLLAVQWLLALWVKTRVEASIKAENDRRLEEYRYEIKTREQAAKVAEYFSYYFGLQSTSSEADYRRVNQLAWELALWLPEDVYRQVAKAVKHNDEDHNVLTSLIAVRKVLLQVPGSLSADELFLHFPNAKEKVKAAQTPPNL